MRGITLASHFVDQLEHIIPLWEEVGVGGGGGTSGYGTLA